MARIHRLETYLASVIDEVGFWWQSRRHESNRLPHVFDDTVVGCVDTMPIIVRRPKTALWRRMTWNGKYKKNVLKVNMVVNNLGAPIFWSLNLGVPHDLTVWRRDHPPLAADEHVLGDAAYACRGEPHLVAPYKHDGGRTLTPAQEAFNRALQWYRSTVEHSFAYLKRFTILAGTYRGQLSRVGGTHYLFHTVKIIVNISALHCRLSPLRIHFPLIANPDPDSGSKSLSQIQAELLIDSGYDFDFFNEAFQNGDVNVEAFRNGRWWLGKLLRVAASKHSFAIRWPDRTVTSGFLARWIRPRGASEGSRIVFEEPDPLLFALDHDL